MMFKIFPTLLTGCLMITTAFANEVSIPADRDTTLIEDAEGDAANGAGPNFFVGHISQAALGIRRGLLHFDVAAVLPGNASVDRVTLRVYQNSSNQEAAVISLHRVLSDWGEGKSFNAGGRGAPAAADDTTWLYTFYDHSNWSSPGGHFVADASATGEARGKGIHTVQGTDKLLNDVRLWLQKPQQNFGWLLMGDENTLGSVKRFSSHENREGNQHPMLTIEYHLPGE